MLKSWLVWFGVLLNMPALAQVGGRQSFEFLALPNNAKLAGLGGINVSAPGPDVNQFYSNPALLQVIHKNQAAFSVTGYVADISHNTLAYGFTPRPGKIFAAGITYFNYGKFIQRDAAGQEEGRFSVTDYSLNVSHASTRDAFTLGATLKFAVSGIAEYKAVGVLADMGGLFKHPEKDFTLGLAFKNMGYQVKSYPYREGQPMPFDVQIGLTYKPEHMPVRFSVTAHHLHQYHIFYADTTSAAVLMGLGTAEETIGGTLLRHLVIGGEFLLSKNFTVQAGYNHLRNRELRLDGAPGAAGFSMGALLQLKAFGLAYSYSFYHKADGAHYVTMGTNLTTLFKSKEKKTR